MTNPPDRQPTPEEDDIMTALLASLSSPAPSHPHLSSLTELSLSSNPNPASTPHRLPTRPDTAGREDIQKKLRMQKVAWSLVLRGPSLLVDRLKEKTSSANGKIPALKEKLGNEDADACLAKTTTVKSSDIPPTTGKAEAEKKKAETSAASSSAPRRNRRPSRHLRTSSVGARRTRKTSCRYRKTEEKKLAAKHAVEINATGTNKALKKPAISEKAEREEKQAKTSPLPPSTTKKNPIAGLPTPTVKKITGARLLPLGNAPSLARRFYNEGATAKFADITAEKKKSGNKQTSQKEHALKTNNIATTISGKHPVRRAKAAKAKKNKAITSPNSTPLPSTPRKYQKASSLPANTPTGSRSAIRSRRFAGNPPTLSRESVVLIKEEKAEEKGVIPGPKLPKPSSSTKRSKKAKRREYRRMMLKETSKKDLKRKGESPDSSFSKRQARMEMKTEAATARDYVPIGEAPSGDNSQGRTRRELFPDLVTRELIVEARAVDGAKVGGLDGTIENGDGVKTESMFGNERTMGEDEIRYNCGRRGHRFMDCMVGCGRCGKDGHRTIDCGIVEFLKR